MNTYGAAREKLLANGYAPVSALRPTVHDYRAADDLAAVLCIPPIDSPLKDHATRRVLALTICTKDKPLRSKILAVLVKHGLAGAPMRTDSAGNATWVWRCDEYSPPMRQHTETIEGELGPAAVLDSWERKAPGAAGESALIPLAGEWTNGSPLTVERSALPLIDSDGIEVLFAELRAVFPRKKYVQPPFIPSGAPEPRVPAYRKRDLRGNDVMLKAHAAAVERGEGEWLPDLEDESA